MKIPADQTPPDDKRVAEGAVNTEQSSNEQTASDEVHLKDKPRCDPRIPGQREVKRGAGNPEQSSNEQTASDEGNLQGPENTMKIPADQTPPDDKRVAEGKVCSKH
ncbi:hypothetical protein DPEC_G00187130, partial [Dallia pectoralis]